MMIIKKEFYNLKEIVQIVNLEYRQLQIRFKIIRKKYIDRDDLIVKKSNVWKIHSSLLKEFERKRKSIDYVLFATIASKNTYSIGYWKFIILELKETLKSIDKNTRIKYVIELNKNEVFHLHFMTTFKKIRELKKIISANMLTSRSNQMNTIIEKIYDVKKLHKYFNKQKKPVLLK